MCSVDIAYLQAIADSEAEHAHEKCKYKVDEALNQASVDLDHFQKYKLLYSD